MTTRELIRANGVREPLVRAVSIKEIEKLIGADCLTVVNLRRDGLVMILDDLGDSKALPYNEAATKLYHSVCKPGTTWVIVGDVVVVPDEDFAERAP